MESKKFHWWLAGYSYNGGNGKYTFCIGDKYVTNRTIKEIEKLESERIAAKCLITQISYLGFMTKEEFEGE